MKFMWESMTKSQLMSSARRIIGLFFIFVFVQMASGQGVTIRTDCVPNPMQRQEGSRICIPFIVDGFTNVPAIQLSFTYNNLIFKPDTVIAPAKNLLDIGPGFFNLSEPGVITLLAITNNPVTYNDGDTLFVLCGTFIGKPGNVLNIQPDVSRIDIIPKDIKDVKIDLCPIEISPINNRLTSILKICATSSAGANDGTMNIKAAGGQGPYNFLVTLAGNTVAQGVIASDTTLSPLVAGVYTINMTDANGANTVETRRVNDNDRIKLRNFTFGPSANGVLNPLCSLGVEGTRHQTGRISVTSFAGEFSYSWSNNSYNYGSASSQSSLEVGTYSLTITDDNTGCSIDTTFTLTAPKFEVSYNVIDKFTCFDMGVTGNIKLLPVGGTGSQYRYRITTDRPGARRTLPIDGILPIGIDIRQISVFDANDCELKIDLRNQRGELLFPRDTYALSQNSLLLPCFDIIDTTYNLRVINTTGPRQDLRIYSITNLTTNRIDALSIPRPSTDPRKFEVGKYKIATATFDQTCRDTFDFEIVRPTKTIHSVAVSQPTCSDTIGSINITSSGGTPPLTYSWAHNNTLRAARLDSVSRGAYRVNVVDANNCAAFDTTITITPSTIVKLDSVVVRKDILCGQPGTIGAFSSNQNTTFTWSNGQTTQLINPTVPGFYTVTAKTGTCEIKDSVEIKELSKINIVLTNKTDALCSTGPNRNSGSVQLGNVSGAVGAFTRGWFKEGQQAEVALNVNSVNNLSAGNYRIKITDASGCVKEENFTIGSTVDTVFVALDRTSITTIQCKGRNNGEAAASATGGNDSNYAIRWSTGQIGQRVTNLASGRNWVVASNQGCFSDTTFFNVVEADTVEVLKNIVNPSCREAPDGKGTVEIVGQQANYEIIWTTINKRGPSFDSLRLGAYPIAIRNIADPTCVIFDTVHVLQSGIFRIAIDSALTSLSGCNSGIPSGQVTLKLDRGTGPVNYTLNGNNLLGGVARGLVGGTYDFIGINAKGCVDTIKSFTLVQSEPVSAQFAKIDSILCNGGKTCIRLTNARGGSGRGYTYAVNFSKNIPIDSCFEVFSGRYKINVFDSDGCGRELEITIGQPEKFEIDLDDEIVYQLGGEKPTIDIKPSIGSNIINVNWSNPDLVECKSDNCQQVQIKEYTTVELLADAVNQNGCIARGRIKLILNEKENVFAPSVLKPDNQVVDFENARWKITIGEGIESIKTLKILDRWGNIVHMAENLNNDYEGWDGRWNGQELPPGVYAYVAEIQFVPVNAISKSKVYAGSITLLK